MAASHKITFIVGATATGKSQLAMQLALQTGAAIVNADSIQCYKHLQIGAAKPTAEDMRQVEHLLYGFVELDQNFTAGDYRRAALKIIEEQITKRPLVFVGGSGFYFQALEKGMYDVSPVPSSIHQKVEKLKAAGLVYEELEKHDQKSAVRIGRQDTYRLERALELVLSENKTLLAIEEDFRSKNKSLGEIYTLEKIGLSCERAFLRERVRARIHKMLDEGLVREVEELIAQGFGGTRALQSVGYREVVAYLRGEMRRDDLIDAIVTSTMQLAKKQQTWFKRDKAIVWRDISTAINS